MNERSVLRASLLAFLAAGITLFVQILAHRMISAKLLNNYAFLIISMTMLGFAFSGVILTWALAKFTAFLEDAMAWCAVLFTLSLITVSAVFYRAPFDLLSGSRPDFIRRLFEALPYALLYALPFLFSGLMIGMLLTSRDLPTRRIYAFDLAGSSLGSIAVIPAISWLGVERASVLACLVLLVGTLLLLPPKRGATRFAVGLALLLVLACFPLSDRVFALRYPEGTMLREIVDSPSVAHIEHVSWDPLARIEISRIPPPNIGKSMYPCLLGDNRDFMQRFQYLITQNNYAFTFAVHYEGHKDDLRGIERTIYASAYEATSVPHPRVLVIGVGGGFDILNALYFDAAHVTAAEINAATTRILKHTYHDYFKAWVDDPRVTLVNAEGRNYLTTSKERYDVIQLSGVDSYSGTPGAANVFSESYLYTNEAFDLYLSKLTDQGILNVMRLEHYPAKEMLRALVTAVRALRKIGVKDVENHVALLAAKSRNFTALLVKRTPFSPDEVAHLKAWADSNPYFDFVAGSGYEPKEPNAYEVFLNLKSPALEQGFTDKYPYDVHPASDDRPFFFRFSYWWHLFPADPFIWASIPVLEYSLLVLLALVGVTALVCIYLPLFLMGSPSLFSERRWRYGLYCAGIALGYLAIEVALLQKFGLLLGHPNYALSIVLAALLLMTGLGSLFSTQLLQVFRNVRFVCYALAFVMILELMIVFPRIPELIAWPFALRAGLVVLLIAPLGLLLGVFFPTVLEALKVSSPGFVPWAWGINGIFSVLAPILSIGLSESLGINALFLAAIPMYLLAALTLP